MAVEDALAHPYLEAYVRVLSYLSDFVVRNKYLTISMIRAMSALSHLCTPNSSSLIVRHMMPYVYMCPLIPF